MKALIKVSDKLIPDRLKPTAKDFGLLWLRVSICGTMILSHGWGKLINFGERSATFPDPFGVGSTLSLSLAVFAEVLCAFLLLIGFASRLVVIPLIVTMAVAFFIVHGDDPWSRSQLSFMFLIPFIALFFTGPGKFSVDGMSR